MSILPRRRGKSPPSRRRPRMELYPDEAATPCLRCLMQDLQDLRIGLHPGLEIGLLHLRGGLANALDCSLHGAADHFRSHDRCDHQVGNRGQLGILIAAQANRRR